MSNYLITAAEVATLLNISKATAYKKIAEWNKDLEANGYFTISGRISRAYVLEHCYGLNDGREAS